MLCVRVREGDAAACGGVDGGDGEVWGGEAYDLMAKGSGEVWDFGGGRGVRRAWGRFCGVGMRV